MGKLKAVFVILLIVVLAFSAGLFAYLQGIGAVDSNDKENVVVTIPQGSGASAIVEILDDAGLVKNKTFAKINARIGGYNSLQANTYVFNKSMTLPEMMSAINSGDFAYISKTAFRVAEGYRLTQSAAALAEVTPYTQEEVLAKWDDREYVRQLIDKYWFLTDDVLDEDVIHPLEGYLFPDTYFIMDDNPSIESITELALDRMGAVLEKRKTEIDNSKFSIHEFLTLASIVTKEGCATDEDASHIAGVFINRLNELNGVSGATLVTFNGEYMS